MAASICFCLKYLLPSVLNLPASSTAAALSATSSPLMIDFYDLLSSSKMRVDPVHPHCAVSLQRSGANGRSRASHPRRWCQGQVSRRTMSASEGSSKKSSIAPLLETDPTAAPHRRKSDEDAATSGEGFFFCQRIQQHPPPPTLPPTPMLSHLRQSNLGRCST
jgi:hypothetical protein